MPHGQGQATLPPKRLGEAFRPDRAAVTHDERGLARKFGAASLRVGREEHRVSVRVIVASRLGVPRLFVTAHSYSDPHRAPHAVQALPAVVA